MGLPFIVTVHEPELVATVQEMRPVTAGLLRIAGYVAADASRLAPVADVDTEPGHEPGTLRDSIHVGSDDTGRVVVQADAFYARYVELGTVHAAPHPFMRPAAAKYRSANRP